MPALALLIRAAADSDAICRNNAVLALRHMHREPFLVVPFLIKSLTDTNALIRANAALVLGDFRGTARSAVPELLKLLGEPPTTTNSSLQYLCIRPAMPPPQH
jgi:HEAT repeat protein